MNKSIILKHWSDLETDLDGNLLLKWFTDAEVMKYVGFSQKCKDIKTPEEAKNFSKLLKDGMFFGIYTPDGKLIGQTTFSRFSNQKCTFGIIIGEKDYWGQGIGTEVTKLMVNHAFKNLNIKKIILETAGQNIAGQKAYQKAGFKIVNEEQDGRVILVDGEWLPDSTVKMEIISNPIINSNNSTQSR